MASRPSVQVILSSAWTEMRLSTSTMSSTESTETSTLREARDWPAEGGGGTSFRYLQFVMASWFLKLDVILTFE